jgi:hypothetical protein
LWTLPLASFPSCLSFTNIAWNTRLAGLKASLFTTSIFLIFKKCFWENLRELKKTDLSFHGSGDNKYIALRDHSTKNHRGDSKDDNESHVMPSNPLCPVKSFVKYLSVL